MSQDVLEIRAIGSAADRESLYDLRGRVLRPGLPPEASRWPGDDDPATIHLGAFLGGHRCVGIASLYAKDGLQLRGMAVEPDLRGHGIGAALVRRVQEIAEAAGQGLWCNARTSAAGFYQRQGWIIEGDPFDIAGIGPHYVMRWRRREES